jgi:phosphopantothenoylcysteine decarboxylase/phosphopantothenate--cysteine ligase
MASPPQAEVVTGGPARPPVVVLGVTGSVAAYKSADVAAYLRRRGIRVIPVLTRGGARFITPALLSAVAGEPTRTSLWDHPEREEHLMLARADVVLVAPASADFLARAAQGRADDLLGTILLARGDAGPVAVAPAMETGMWRNPVTQGHVAALRARGWHVLGPEEGYLASGAWGSGRLVDPQHLAAFAAALATPKDLHGLRVLVTAGPTHEPLDPVRYLTSRSSGKMGFAVAARAAARGARVVLLTGPTALADPPLVERVERVQRAEELDQAAQRWASWPEVVVAAAAVSDYRPLMARSDKMRRSAERWELSLVRNPDVLARLAQAPEREGRILVGFAAEVGDPEASAREKLSQKGLDLCVGNDVTEPGSGFGADTNRVVLVDRTGQAEWLPRMSKEDVADRLLDRALALRQRRGAEG